MAAYDLNRDKLSLVLSRSCSAEHERDSRTDPYLGFFEFVHNVRRQGKALLGSLIELLVSKDPETQ